MKKLISLLVFSLACGGTAPELQQLSPDAIGSAEAAVRAKSHTIAVGFESNHATAVAGTPFAGSTLMVSYDRERLPQCRGELQGRPAWTITAFWRQNGGGSPSQEGSFHVAGHTPNPGETLPYVHLPEEGEIEFWFQVHNRWGCTAWDSNEGKNWRIKIAPAPTTQIRFTADGRIEQVGDIRGGEVIRIDYAAERLPRCRGKYHSGGDSWGITGFASIDGGPAQRLGLSGPVGDGPTVALPDYLGVPTGASKLALWFRNDDLTGCEDWDSQDGRHYVFDVK